MIRQQKDLNESFIIAIYTGLGLYAQQMDRTAGYDLVVHGMLGTAKPYGYFWHGPEIIEIKSSIYKARPDQLTKNEQKTKAAIEAAGGIYWIVVDGYDALAAIGLSIRELETPHLLGIAEQVSNLKNIDPDILPMVQEFQRDILDRIEQRTYAQ